MSVRFYRVIECKTDDRAKEPRFGAGTIDRACDEKRRKQDEEGRAENDTDKSVSPHPTTTHAGPHSGDGNLYN
jgi:hypothetical protein